MYLLRTFLEKDNKLQDSDKIDRYKEKDKVALKGVGRWLLSEGEQT